MDTAPTVVVAEEAFEPWFAEDELMPAARDLFASADGRMSCKHPALLSCRNRLLIVLPRFYAGRTRDRGELGKAQRATVQTLIRALRDAREQRHRSIESSELEIGLREIGDARDLLATLEAAMLLWEDYQEHGPLLLSRRRTSPRERGRIHWPKTYRGSLQLKCGPNLVFVDPVETRFAIDTEHPLTRLHMATCDAAARLLGWLPPGREWSVSTRAEALDLLERERRGLFQDRHIRVWNEMHRFYSSLGRADGRRSDQMTGAVATGFPHIWERMLKAALAPEASYSLPSGRYQGVAPHGSARGLVLRPDLVIRRGDEHVVIDAKDYREGGNPASGSIVKQILYRYLLSREYAADGPALERVHNAFIMPAALPAPRLVERRATHTLSDDHRGLGTIACLALDFPAAAAAYARGRPDGSLRAAVVGAVMAREG